MGLSTDVVQVSDFLSIRLGATRARGALPSVVGATLSTIGSFRSTI